jgi:RND family efflux transporter MFP subunit
MKRSWNFTKILIQVVPVCLVLGISLQTVSCSRAGRASVADTQTGKSQAVSVAVAMAVRQDLSRDQVMMAEFRPYQEIDVHAKVAGYVKEMLVDVGDQVKAGQVLARLEIPELKAELDQAEAARARGEEEIKQAESELNRAKASHNEAHITYNRLASVNKVKAKLIAQEEIDQAFARDQVAEAQVATAQAAVSVARKKLMEHQASEERVKSMVAYSRIDAPFAGVISKRYADLGAMIPAGTSTTTQGLALVRLSEDDRLRLVLPVPESIVPLIHKGASVEIKVQSINRTFKGVISRFTSRVDTATRTMDTEVEVPNPGLLLKPGMYASATLTLDRAPNALVVPLQAVVTADQRTTVLVVGADNDIEERTVTLGLETPTMVGITSGLRDNEMVVTGNQGQLRPGQRVEPKLTDPHKE